MRIENKAGATARGVAIFVAAFSLLNIIGALFSPGFDANLWWIDMSFLPRPVGNAALLACATLLGMFGLGLSTRVWTQRFICVACCFLALVTCYNTLFFFAEWSRGRIAPGVPLPLSLGLTLVFVLLAGYAAPGRAAGPTGPTGHCSRLPTAIAFALACGIFPLAQMFCFGQTDYRRPADAIVVFGARAYADGTPSDVLADRVRIAVALYHEQHARLFICSGGPGDGGISEPQAMRTLALALGVEAEDILLDEGGLNTDLTVRNTAALFQERGIRRILAVSHFYHLPRVKMTFARSGIEAYTVPVRRALPGLPYYMGRETAALWAYYFRPLLSILS